MSRKITAGISISILNQLFNDLGIWTKICDGTLTTFPLSPVPSSSYPGCTSRILLHFDGTGKHIATTHRIMDEKTLKIYHWDAKGLQLNEVWLWR